MLLRPARAAQRSEAREVCRITPLTPLERLLACPQADPAKLLGLKRLRETTDPFALAKIIEQKLERIYQFANHRVSPSPEIPQQPLNP